MLRVIIFTYQLNCLHWKFIWFESNNLSHQLLFCIQKYSGFSQYQERSFTEGTDLFPIASHPRELYKRHLFGFYFPQNNTLCILTSLSKNLNSYSCIWHSLPIMNLSNGIDLSLKEFLWVRLKLSPSAGPKLPTRCWNCWAWYWRAESAKASSLALLCTSTPNV